MNRKINYCFIAFALVALMGSASRAPVFAQAINVDAAKKEGKVIVYGAQVPQAMKPLHAAFQQKYGIQVDYWRGSSTKVSERALKHEQFVAFQRFTQLTGRCLEALSRGK